MRFFTFLAFALVAAIFNAQIRAADVVPQEKDLVKATLLADVDAVAPGSSFTLGVHLKMKPHWHTYWVNPGESGEATTLKIAGPTGFEFGKVQWPLPRAIESFGAITYGYEDEVMLLIPVTVAKDVKVQGAAAINVHAVWLACHDTCIEGEAKLAISLPISEKNGPANREKFDPWRERVPTAAAAAMKSVGQVISENVPHPALTIDWTEEVRKVEWFPISTKAVAIENVQVKHERLKTQIAFKPTVYKPDRVPGGKVEGVVVFEDSKGRRQGVLMSFKVPVE